MVSLLALSRARGHVEFTTKALSKAKTETEEHDHEKRAVRRALDIRRVLGRREQLLVSWNMALLIHEASVRSVVGTRAGKASCLTGNHFSEVCTRQSQSLSTSTIRPRFTDKDYTNIQRV